MAKKTTAGVVLVFVVWSMAIIGLVVTFSLERNFIEALRRREMKAALTGRALAQAEMEVFLARFLGDTDEVDTPTAAWFPPAEGSFFSSGKSRIIVTDLGSRLNLNTADEAALLAFFGGAREPVAAILDWRDEDQEPRSGGAEADYYAGLSPPRRPADGFFLAPEEMSFPKGMDKFAGLLAEEATIFGRANPNLIGADVFYALLRAAGAAKWEAETITAQFAAFRQEALVAGRLPFRSVADLHRLPALGSRLIEALAPGLCFGGLINPNLAGEHTLAAALAELGLNPEKVRLIIERRPFTDWAGFSSLLLAGEEKDRKKDWVAQVFTLTTTLVQVEAVGYPELGGEYRIKAVLERLRSGGRFFTARVLYWQEGYYPAAKKTGEGEGEF